MSLLMSRVALQSWSVRFGKQVCTTGKGKLDGLNLLFRHANIPAELVDRCHATVSCAHWRASCRCRT
eukprot:1944603-Pyramimonas_sp.AAC.1